LCYLYIYCHSEHSEETKWIQKASWDGISKALVRVMGGLMDPSPSLPLRVRMTNMGGMARIKLQS